MTTSASPLAALTVPTAGSGPYALAVGPDGHLWCTLVHAGRIARLTPSTGRVEEFALDSPDCGPTLITAGPDGALW
ncbi:virginiamycin B lyase family protein, partial [Streptomyces nojiriensis]